MPRDLPDWNALSSQATVFEVTDVGELAARLGSPVTFDRRGDVLWLDTFDAGLEKWLATEQNSDDTVQLSSLHARSGRYCVNLSVGVGALAQAFIRHRLPIIVLSNVGLEVAFETSPSFGEFEVRLAVWDGSFLTIYNILIDNVNDTLSYWDSSGSWVVFASGVTTPNLSTLFNHAKVVVNTNTRQYVRFLLNNSEYSLEEIDANVSVSGAVGRVEPRLLHRGQSGLSGDVWVDDPIVTQNEPA